MFSYLRHIIFLYLLCQRVSWKKRKKIGGEKLWWQQIIKIAIKTDDLAQKCHKSKIFFLFGVFSILELRFCPNFVCPNCQNSLFQTVKISYSNLSKFPFSNCQNFPFQAVKISLSKLSKISFSKLSKFPIPICQNFLFKLFQTSQISVENTPKLPTP
jgi:hypothetical protein